MAEKLDIESFRKWIGREESAADIVTAELVKRFRATLASKRPRCCCFAIPH